MSSEPTHIYVDLDILNNDQTTNDDPPHLRFEETRNAPFVDGDTKDYFCSIIRFSLQTGNSLPIFIPRIQTGQDDANQTVYSVSLQPHTSSGVQGIHTVFLQYESWNSAPTPQPPQSRQDLSTDYYYVNSYQQFVQMINRALKSCHDAAYGSAAVKPAIPYVQFDTQTHLFVLYCDQGYYDTPSQGIPPVANPAKIWFNNRLYQLLSTFPAKFNGTQGELNYRIVVDSTLSGKNRVYNDTGALLYTQVPVYQEISTVATWNPVASIVFGTSLIPVLPTQTSPAKLFNGDSTNMTSGGNNANISSILTDFEVTVTENNQYRPTISMNPTSEFRLIEMNSVTNLNKIDLIAYWKTHYGDLIPLKLQPGCAAHVKVMFRHRRFNNE